MENTINILKSIIAGIVSPVIVEAVGLVLDGAFPVTSSDTQWLHMNQQLTIEGNDYKVVAIEQNISFSLQQRGHVEVISGSFNIAPPWFFYGTWKMTNTERDDVGEYKDKTPFIWLVEVRDENIHLDPKDAVDRDAELQLLFMGESNFGDWLTEDHYDQVINPLSVLVRNFLDSVERSRCVSKPLAGEMATINHANAGSVDADGHLKALFNEELSGIEATVTLPFNKCCT